MQLTSSTNLQHYTHILIRPSALEYSTLTFLFYLTEILNNDRQDYY